MQNVLETIELYEKSDIDASKLLFHFNEKHLPLKKPMLFMTVNAF